MSASNHWQWNKNDVQKGEASIVGGRFGKRQGEREKLAPTSIETPGFIVGSHHVFFFFAWMLVSI
jgi:hypothetical protein